MLIMRPSVADGGFSPCQFGNMPGANTHYHQCSQSDNALYNLRDNASHAMGGALPVGGFRGVQKGHASPRVCPL